MGTKSLLRLLAVLGALAAVMVVAVSGAAADTVPLPADASYNPEVNASACPGAGDCVAVGSYEDSSDNYYGLIETESGGSWTVNTASLAGLEPDTSPNEGLRSVSCTSIGNCVAVGYYADSSGNDQGLIETESGGTWTASTASLAGLSSVYGDPGVQLDSISCPSAGNCAAIGIYYDSTGTQQGLIETESDGSWTASEAPLPSGGTGVHLAGVSCPAAGDCVAVGNYSDGSGTQQGLVETESGGSWTASEAPLPGGPGSGYLTGVSCASAGDCVAVGTDYAAGGLIETDSGGSWSASAVDLSNLDASPDSSSLVSVACVSVGNCAAVGDYGDTSGDQQGLMLSESGGDWSASEADLTGLDAYSSGPDAQLDSVACWSAGDCVAGGNYNNASIIEKNELVTSESDGSWSTYDQQVAGGGYDIYGSFAACAPGGYCTIDSISGNGSETDAAMLDAPDAVSTPAASLSGTQASVSWAAPSDDGGLPVSGYTVTVEDQTDPARGGQTASTTAGVTTATFSGLTPGDSYTFTITALSPVGVGLPASTAAVSVAGTTPTVAVSGTASQTTWYPSVGSIPAITVSGTVDASGLRSFVCSGDGIASQSFTSVTGGTLSLSGLDSGTGTITCVVTANDGLTDSVSFTLHLWPPLKITDISLSGSTVTWCGKHCRWPSTQVRFTLTRPASVRLVLRTRRGGRWHQVTTALIHAHNGRNRDRLAGRWHNHLLPSGKSQILVQIEQNGHWQTHKTLTVTVRHTRSKS